MRVTQDSEEKTVIFIKDMGKSTLCECPHCSNEIIIFADTAYLGDPTRCRFCGGELVYPGWASW
jgi:ribosomal protein S27E